ncbi:EF-hand calcium-binding domain-containing protein 4A [Aplochiton taeniatus]
MVQPETMGKAKEMFVLCDKEGKGFITMRDMQRLQRELPLSPEQLESVFESLDREKNGFLTPIEFNMGLGDLMGLDETSEQSQVEPQEAEEQTESGQDPGGLRFTQILTELGADKLFKDQWELCSLWVELQRERPDLLGVLDQVLAQTVAHLQDSLKERDSLEQALRRRANVFAFVRYRRESEHNQVVQSIYEEMESQLREEKQKRLAQDSIKQWDRVQQLQEELKARELELDSSLSKQKELETRIQLLSGEQVEMKETSQQLQGLNLQLQEQLENSREDLQSALAQLNLIQSHSDQEHIARQSNVLKVSKNMQKEKDSLLRQLEMLRDMNKRLRDEKDAHLSQKRTLNVRQQLQKKGSIIGNYLLQDKTLKRQLSSSYQLEGDRHDKSNTSKRRQPANKGKLDSDMSTEAIQTGVISPQRVFKVVFLGNSGVGKSSFIQHYCTGHFPNALRTTVGIDFQMRSVTLGSTTIVLQLWDTAGQERFRSMTQQYYRKADGILTMYDVTNSPSFTAARGWMECLQERMSDGAVLMLLGNKLDMVDCQKREVTTKQGQTLAEQYEASFYECSAKTGHNIEDLMTQLARLLSAQQDQQCEGTLLLEQQTTNRSCCN